MAKFEQVNRDVNNVITSLLSNQTLCKLLFYFSDSPLSEPDIPDTSILISEHKCVSPYPRVLGIKDEKASYVNVYLNRFRLDSGNKGTKDCLLTFDVLVHNDKWLLPNQELIRPLLILSEIDKLVNKQRIAGIKDASFNTGDILVPNVSYSGYRMTYSIASVN